MDVALLNEKEAKKGGIGKKVPSTIYGRRKRIKVIKTNEVRIPQKSSRRMKKWD
jgi:hypothetical protein